MEVHAHRIRQAKVDTILWSGACDEKGLDPSFGDHIQKMGEELIRKLEANCETWEYEHFRTQMVQFTRRAFTGKFEKVVNGVLVPKRTASPTATVGHPSA